MESESDKGGEGRGLPVGWGWRPRTGAWNEGEVDLYPPGADVGEERATVYPSGKWETWEKGHSAQIMAHGTTADGAAAQAVAEAALWATDGYGTGEVRGLRLSLLDISDAAALVASRQTVALPGLSGWWIVRAARSDGGAEGVEVDAVRAPVAGEPAAAIDESMPLQREFTALRIAGFAVRAPVEPAPRAGDLRCPECKGTGVYVEDHGLGAVEELTCPCAQGEPAPREPSAPTDGAELARLLRDLPLRIAYTRQAARDDEPLDAAIRDLADGAELLLAERAKTERRIAILMQTADAGEIAVGALERLRPRAEEAERRVAELTATPPPGTVAALLADLKRMREEGDGDMREAIEAVREHLGAPTPLDAAVAEVCAVDVSEVVDTFDAWSALGDICRAEANGAAEERAQFAKAGRVALAGMLACDASATLAAYGEQREEEERRWSAEQEAERAAKGGA